MSRLYPPTMNLGTVNALLTIKSQMDVDEGFLDDEKCPYDAQTKADIRTLLAPRVIEVEKVVDKIVEVERVVEKFIEKAADGGKRGPKQKSTITSDIEQELKEVTEDLRALKIDAKEKLSTGDRLQILKTRAALIERMAQVREKVTNIKKVSMFVSTILTITDDMMNDDQRQIFMKRLEPYAEME